MKSLIYSRKVEAIRMNEQGGRLTFTHGNLPNEGVENGLCRLRLEADSCFNLVLSPQMDYTVIAIIKNGHDWTRIPGDCTFGVTEGGSSGDYADHYDFLCKYRTALAGELEGWELKYVDVYPDILRLFYVADGEDGKQTQYQSIELRSESFSMTIADNCKGKKEVVEITSCVDGMGLTFIKSGSHRVFVNVLGEGWHYTTIERIYPWAEKKEDAMDVALLEKLAKSKLVQDELQRDKYYCWEV